MTSVHVAVGSNIDPGTHIPSGLARLHEAAPIVASSRFYRTAAIGRPDQDDYWNGVVVIATDLEPAAFHAMLRDIEAREGRVRGSDKWAARELDLDVLLAEGAPVAGAAEEIDARPFLRWCLADLAGQPDPDAGRVAARPWPHL